MQGTAFLRLKAGDKERDLCKCDLDAKKRPSHDGQGSCKETNSRKGSLFAGSSLGSFWPHCPACMQGVSRRSCVAGRDLAGDGHIMPLNQRQAPSGGFREGRDIPGERDPAEGLRAWRGGVQDEERGHSLPRGRRETWQLLTRKTAAWRGRRIRCCTELGKPGPGFAAIAQLLSHLHPVWVPLGASLFHFSGT